MELHYCDLCGKRGHIRRKIVRYRENQLNITSNDPTEYAVCDECNDKLNEARIKADYETVLKIRYEYKNGCVPEEPLYVTKKFSELASDDEVLIKYKESDSNKPTEPDEPGVNPEEPEVPKGEDNAEGEV